DPTCQEYSAELTRRKALAKDLAAATEAAITAQAAFVEEKTSGSKSSKRYNKRKAAVALLWDQVGIIQDAINVNSESIQLLDKSVSLAIQEAHQSLTDQSHKSVTVGHSSKKSATRSKGQMVDCGRLGEIEKAVRFLKTFGNRQKYFLHGDKLKVTQQPCSKDCPASLDKFCKPEAVRKGSDSQNRKRELTDGLGKVAGDGFIKKGSQAELQVREREQARQVALMNARLEKEALEEERRRKEEKETHERAVAAAKKAQEAVQKEEGEFRNVSKEVEDAEWKVVPVHKKGATAVKPKNSNKEPNRGRRPPNCKFFGTGRGCLKGSSCTFLHISSDMDPREQSGTSSSTCRLSNGSFSAHFIALLELAHESF
ncbi:hypothetical protein HDU76_000491, partial [Blyttiomyces sp. JEL0837]